MIYTTDEIKSGRFYTDDEEWMSIDCLRDELKELIDDFPEYNNAQELILRIFRLREKLSSKPDDTHKENKVK